MRIIKKTMLLIICFMISLILKGNTVFAKSVIQVVPNVAAWNNISVSDAYDVCQDLNADYSTLGTDKLKAHLTTNADWYAVSLLAYSDYGNKSASNTTGNNTGIQKLSASFTASLVENYVNNDYISKLVVNLETPYVETIQNSKKINENVKGRGLMAYEILTSSEGSVFLGASDSLPVCVRKSLFTFCLGAGGGSTYFGNSNASQGKPYGDITFRPVIWNK